MSNALKTTAEPLVIPAATSARAGIASIAAALPDRTVTSDEIGAGLGLEPGWIASRTGITERRHAAPDQTLVDLASKAASIALERAGLGGPDLDLVLVATSTADDRVPTAAPLVADRIGAQRAAAIDVGAACTGFISALELAASAVEAGRARAVLVLGAELMSRVIDFDDPRTAGLFGDGAGAAVIVPGGGGTIGRVRLHSDAAGAGYIVASHADNKVRMDGRATFRAAVARLSEVTLEVAADAGRSLDEIDLFVYHQANARILRAVGERLALPPYRVVDSIATHGNTSAASIPIALDQALSQGVLRDDSTVLLGAFGAGLTWGGCLVEWGRS